jgi:DNA-binding SARP family transcriptional activator
VDFRLLGPVEARVGGRRVDLGPAKQRCVLAVLLAQAGRPVPTDVLVARVWGDKPPAEARGTLYSYLTRLRRILAGTGAGPERTPGGYVLAVPEDRVDLHRFKTGKDLDEWRGEPLYGLSGEWAEQVRAGLRRRHVELLAAWAEEALAAGDAAVVVDRLGGALDEYPHAESLIEVFLRALRADGRTAEALEFFEAKRTQLRAELGVRPGVALREIHQQLLAPAGPAPAKPGRLPAAPVGFAGRAAALAQLDDAVLSAASVIVISGPGGVGKTALALTWSQHVSALFPDGCLHIDLRGYARGEPMRASEALSTLLQALGVAPEDVPLDDASAAALYRSLLAGRRMLVLLDNAGSTEQVRPLLPGTPGSLAVITGRDRLGDLVANVGARRVCLGPLEGAEAIELLSRALGADRVHGDEAGAAELAASCGRFPLALRIAAAHLAERPGLSLGRYVLPAFAVQAGFALSYRRLPDAERRVFRLLGSHPGSDFTAETVAALTGLPPANAKRALRLLASANLVEQRTSSHFAFHDLLRRYAVALNEQGRALAG